MKPVVVNDANFENEVLKSDIPVLVDFWAVWCGPCKMIAPTIDEIAAEYDGKIKVAKMDVDSNPTTSMKYGVRSIPTLLIFKSGTVAEQMVRAQQTDFATSADLTPERLLDAYGEDPAHWQDNADRRLVETFLKYKDALTLNNCVFGRNLLGLRPRGDRRLETGDGTSGAPSARNIYRKRRTPKTLHLD